MTVGSLRVVGGKSGASLPHQTHPGNQAGSSKAFGLAESPELLGPIARSDIAKMKNRT